MTKQIFQIWPHRLLHLHNAAGLVWEGDTAIVSVNGPFTTHHEGCFHTVWWFFKGYQKMGLQHEHPPTSPTKQAMPTVRHLQGHSLSVGLLTWTKARSWPGRLMLDMRGGECAGNILYRETWGGRTSGGGWGISGRGCRTSGRGWRLGAKGGRVGVVKLFILHVQTALGTQERLAGAVGALTFQTLRGLRWPRVTLPYQ